jgi:hypothetical protein
LLRDPASCAKLLEKEAVMKSVLTLCACILLVCGCARNRGGPGQRMAPPVASEKDPAAVSNATGSGGAGSINAGTTGGGF